MADSGHGAAVQADAAGHAAPGELGVDVVGEPERARVVGREAAREAARVAPARAPHAGRDVGAHNQEIPAIFTDERISAWYYFYEGAAPYADASGSVTLMVPRTAPVRVSTPVMRWCTTSPSSVVWCARALGPRMYTKLALPWR